MKNKYNYSDCQQLRKLLIYNAKNYADKNGENILLLSGGMDSVTALYALTEANINFKAYTFYFNDFTSVDKIAVARLQKAMGFRHEFIEIPNDWNTIKKDVMQAIEFCKLIYGKVREVKVETIFALRYVDKFLESGGVIFSGSTGDAVVGYNRNTAIMAAKIGEENPKMIEQRTLAPSENEFDRIFSERHKSVSIFTGAVEKFILGFTTRACNSPKPKAFLYHAFSDYHNKYKSYRIPKAFQKAGNEKAMFNMIAIQNGYKDALAMFKAIQR